MVIAGGVGTAESVSERVSVTAFQALLANAEVRCAAAGRAMKSVLIASERAAH